MKQHFEEIARIIYERGLAIPNHGLMHGNTGLVIFYCHLAKSINNKKYEQIADNLLDKVFSNLGNSTSTDFENGLAGVGWGIEYLVQNNFAEGDTDEILEEIDNKVFKALNEEKFTSFELTNGLTGYLFYLINRLKSPANPKSMAQRINQELLILVINKLDELVTIQFPSIVKDLYFDLLWRFPVLLYGLTEAFKFNIYNEKIICMVKQWLPNFEAYIPSMHTNRLYMATVLTKINEIVPTTRLERQIQILLFSTDFECLKTEVDPHVLNITLGWPGVVWLLQNASIIIPKTWPNYSLIGSTSNEIIAKYSGTINNVLKNIITENPAVFGLSNGIAGMGLLELLWPEILNSTRS